MSRRDISKCVGYDVPEADILGSLEADGEIERIKCATGDLFRYKAERFEVVTGEPLQIEAGGDGGLNSRPSG
jgi:hypothetical protein